MRKATAILWAIFAVVLVGSMLATNAPTTAKAAAQDYAWTYNRTNIYSGCAACFFVYNLNDLDATVQYTFTAQSLDANGNPTGNLAQRIIGPLVTATSSAFSMVPHLDFPTYTGPLRFIDNFNQVLGMHYVLTYPSADWIAAAGVNNDESRICIGNCVYNETNGFGYAHDSDAHTGVLIASGDRTFLHYSLSSTSTEKIVIRSLTSGSELIEIFAADLLEYESEDACQTDPYPCLPLPDPINGFVVLSTNGTRPAFINPNEDNTAWATVNNPHLLTVAKSAYDYELLTLADSHVASGESIWLVGANSSYEWAVETLVDPVTETKTQIAQFRENTREIWDSYRVHLFTDGILGILDDTDYAFSTRRRLPFSVGTAAESVEVTWAIEATSLNVPEIAGWFEFIVTSNSYDIVAAGTGVKQLPPLKVRTKNLIRSLGCTSQNVDRCDGLDTPWGHVILMLAGMVGGFFVARKFHQPFIIQMLAFLGIGGLLIVFGIVTDVLTIMIFAISTLIIAITILRRRDSGGAENE